jgi:NAD(P)-dependent dehydrogenase (short-subunit alcohol dehydrogenase family)
MTCHRSRCKTLLGRLRRFARLSYCCRKVRAVQAGCRKLPSSLESRTRRFVAGATAAGGIGRATSPVSRRAGSTRICSRWICASATRGACSWHEVPTVELLEVQLVNAIAPFILNARLKPLMLRTPERDKHIVNVSAVEGSFTGSSRPRGIRTRTWPRPRST